MPLPDTPMTLEGGCNCGAIRYQVRIPAKDQRPIYPAGGGDVDPPIRMPMSVTDHCNDCRAATGAVLNCWLLTPTYMASVALVKRSLDLMDGRLGPNASKGPWRPASEVFLAEHADEDSYLAFFASSPQRRRIFCARCGTMFAYCIFPTPDWLEFGMLDIILGTIDKQFFARVELKPERQMWWKVATDWVKGLSRNGLDVPVHADGWVKGEVQLSID